jgi:hypothetical protein
MKRKPHNPGLSEEAWRNLHVILTRLTIKYADKIKQEDLCHNKMRDRKRKED